LQPNPTSPPLLTDIQSEMLQRFRQQLSQVILGKAAQIDLLIIALLSQGHVLLEDIPGIGKTTLAKAFARLSGCQFSRIQFTPDLLPSDVLGTALYNPGENRFIFREGPVFTQMLMADEINRASPRTQSSLLEAMAEGQVTIDGELRPLPPPFMVIATQNPVEHHGTYPLPEAQLDRFAMCLQLGYPEPTQELEMLFNQQHSTPVADLPAVLSSEEVYRLQQATGKVTVSDAVGRYLIQLVTATRQHPDIQLGISPRGALTLFQAAKARALLEGRTFVLPDDIKVLAQPVLAHRLQLQLQARYSGRRKPELIQELLQQLPVPR
jgi:MoxR-like ATPase